MEMLINALINDAEYTIGHLSEDIKLSLKHHFAITIATYEYSKYTENKRKVKRTKLNSINMLERAINQNKITKF